MRKTKERFQFSLASLLLLAVGLAGLGVLIARWESWVRIYSIQGEGYEVTMAPDRQTFITTDARGVATLWETRTGRQLLSFPGHKVSMMGAMNAAFSRDGRHLATSDGKGVIRVWEVASGSLQATLTGHTKSVLKLQFSGDGTRLLSVGYDRAVVVWDVQAATALWQTSASPAHFDLRAALAPNGGQVLVAEAVSTVRVYDVASGKVVKELKRNVPRFVSRTEIGADGKWALVSFQEAAVHGRMWTTVWNLETGKEMGTFDGFCVASHEDDSGMRVLAFPSGLWGIPECRKIKEFPLVSIDARFSPDGQRIVSNTRRSAGVFDLATGRLEYEVPTGDSGEVFLLPEPHLILNRYTEAFVYDAPSTYKVELWALTYPEPAWGHVDRPELWVLVVAVGLLLVRFVRWASKRVPTHWRRRRPRLP